LSAAASAELALDPVAALANATTTTPTTTTSPMFQHAAPMQAGYAGNRGTTAPVAPPLQLNAQPVGLTQDQPAPQDGVTNGNPSATASPSAPSPDSRILVQSAHAQTVSAQSVASQSAPLPVAVAPAADSASAAAGAQQASASQPSSQPSYALQVGPANPAANPPALPNVHALAVSMASQSQSGTRQFDIRLDPPELGRVDVRLTVDSAGKAQAHLAVDKPQTLELLQRDSGTLARALRDSGVQLNNNGLQFSLKGQGRQSGGAPSRGRSLAVSAVAAPSAVTASTTSSFTASAAGVDIRV
jgi:flagellar hook-length control protein FliK